MLVISQPAEEMNLSVSERVMVLQLLDKPININIIQAYVTADKSDENDDFYKQLGQSLELTKLNKINTLMGDFNVILGEGRVVAIGEGRKGAVAGQYGLGNRNERGERLIQHCENNLIIKNTWYKLPFLRLYSWKSPQDKDQHIERNQINYIMIQVQFQELDNWSYYNISC